MNNHQFTHWRQVMQWSRARAAKALGKSERTLAYYESGELTVPLTVELACAALALGIRSYAGPD